MAIWKVLIKSDEWLWNINFGVHLLLWRRELARLEGYEELWDPNIERQAPDLNLP